MLYENEIQINVTRNISTNQRTANVQEGYYLNAKITATCKHNATYHIAIHEFIITY